MKSSKFNSLFYSVYTISRFDVVIIVEPETLIRMKIHNSGYQVINRQFRTRRFANNFQFVRPQLCTRRLE